MRDVLIAGGEKDVKSFKEINRITDDGEREVFRDTDEKKIEKKAYKPEDSRFIRSKLPLRHAARIGGSGLKTKPFRLTFTVLLCTVAFVLFGLLSTMTFYDRNATLRQPLLDSSMTMLRLEKQYKGLGRYYKNGELISESLFTNTTRFHPDDLAAYEKEYGDGVFGAVSTYSSVSAQSTSSYYQTDVKYFAYLKEGHPLREAAIPGSTYPEKSDEIWVSTYLADVLMNAIVYDDSGKQMTISSHGDLLGKRISVGGSGYTVTGVFDSGAMDPRFEALKGGTADTGTLIYEFENHLADTLHQVVFVTEETMAWHGDSHSDYVSFGEHRLVYADLYDADQGFIYGDSQGYGSAYTTLSGFLAVIDPTFFEAGKTTLSDDQVMVSAQLFFGRIQTILGLRLEKMNNVYFDESYYSNAIEALDYSEYNPPEQDYFLNGMDIINLWRNDAENEKDAARPQNAALASLYEEYVTDFRAYQQLQQRISYHYDLLEMCYRLSEGGVWEHDEETGEYFLIPLTAETEKSYLAALLAEMTDMEDLYTVAFRLYSNETGSAMGAEREKTIVGFYRPNSRDVYFHETPLLFSDATYNEFYKEHVQSSSYFWEEYTEYEKKSGAYISAIFVSYDHSEAATDNIIALYNARNTFAEDEWERVAPRSSITDNFYSVDSMVKEMSKIFLYVGLVLAVFAALLLSNFISISISYKKREIGILRAVGARSLDVFKIFFSESLIITAICVLLSTVGSIALCAVLNAEIASMIGASLFVFGLLSFAVLVGVALLTALVATFLPVYNAAKKKPVDSIRAL